MAEIAPRDIHSYLDIPKKTKRAIKQDISRRVVAIVADHAPEPVLMAKVNAMITAETPLVDTAEGVVLGTKVSIGHTGIVAFAAQLAVEKREVVFDSWGEELTLRLPDEIEAGHVTT